MRVMVATEARLFRGSDGVIRSSSHGRGYAFWTRYLDGFDEVVVLARVSDEPSNATARVTGPGVSVHALPDFRGPQDAVRNYRKLTSAIRRARRFPDMAFIARTPGIIASELVRQLRNARIPYGLEVVGDPGGVLSSGTLGRLLGRALRPIAVRDMRRQCENVSAVAYVTEETLQRAYPAPHAELVTHYSSVELPPSAYRARETTALGKPPALISVGNMTQSYKGHDVLIGAVAALAARAFPVRLNLVGDGPLRPTLEGVAKQAGVDGLVDFTGHVSDPDELRQLLDNADLFVLPSLTEGLPRALIEAMARGLPAIATSVGGIPELLPQEDLVPPGDVEALAGQIRECLGDGDRREAMSHRNSQRASQYAQASLRERRASFYRSLSDISMRKRGTSR